MAPSKIWRRTRGSEGGAAGNKYRQRGAVGKRSGKSGVAASGWRKTDGVRRRRAYRRRVQGTALQNGGGDSLRV
jgi:hypothetical protein